MDYWKDHYVPGSPLLTKLDAGIPDGKGLAYAIILLEECRNEIARLMGELINARMELGHTEK